MMSQIAELAAMTSSRPAFVIGIRAKYRKRSSGPFDHRHRTATCNHPRQTCTGNAVDHLVNVLVGSRALIERHVTRLTRMSLSANQRSASACLRSLLAARRESTPPAPWLIEYRLARDCRGESSPRPRFAHQTVAQA